MSKQVEKMRVKVIREVHYYVVIQMNANDISSPALFRGVWNVQIRNCPESMQMCQNIYHGFYKICKTIRICRSIIRKHIPKIKTDDGFTDKLNENQIHNEIDDNKWWRKSYNDDI